MSGPVVQAYNAVVTSEAFKVALKYGLITSNCVLLVEDLYKTSTEVLNASIEPRLKKPLKASIIGLNVIFISVRVADFFCSVIPCTPINIRVTFKAASGGTRVLKSAISVNNMLKIQNPETRKSAYVDITADTIDGLVRSAADALDLLPGQLPLKITADFGVFVSKVCKKPITKYIKRLVDPERSRAPGAARVTAAPVAFQQNVVINEQYALSERQLMLRNELLEAESINDLSAIPTDLYVEAVLSLYICGITQEPIRHLLVISATQDDDQPVYYERAAFENWCDTHPDQPPLRWPDHVPFTPDGVEHDVLGQHLIDRCLEENFLAVRKRAREFVQQEINKIREIPESLSTDTVLALHTCSISDKPIRSILVVSATKEDDNPIYYEKSTFDDWCIRHPDQPPPQWPAQVPFAPDRLEKDLLAQSFIDKRCRLLLPDLQRIALESLLQGQTRVR